jgi:WD40 repeat protein
VATIWKAGGLINLWDPQTGHALSRLPFVQGGWSIDALAFSADGKNIASAGCKGAVVWNVAGRAVTKALEGPVVRARAITFSPDGKTLAGAWEGFGFKNVLVWDLPKGEVKVHLDVGGKYGGEPRALAFSKNGKFLAVGGLGRKTQAGDKENPPRVFVGIGHVQFWHVPTGRRGPLLKLPHPCEGLALSPDGRTLAVACWDGAIYQYDVTGLENKQ